VRSGPANRGHVDEMDAGPELPRQPSIGVVAALYQTERAPVGALLRTYLDVEVFLAAGAAALALMVVRPPRGAQTASWLGAGNALPRKAVGVSHRAMRSMPSLLAIAVRH
jgi:hypothetical protein